MSSESESEENSHPQSAEEGEKETEAIPKENDTPVTWQDLVCITLRR